MKRKIVSFQYEQPTGPLVILTDDGDLYRMVRNAATLIWEKLPELPAKVERAEEILPGMKEHPETWPPLRKCKCGNPPVYAAKPLQGKPYAWTVRCGRCHQMTSWHPSKGAAGLEWYHAQDSVKVDPGAIRPETTQVAEGAKPCICGAERPLLLLARKEDTAEMGWIIRCVNCGLTTQPRETAPEALAAWNGRETAPKTSEEEVKPLDCVCGHYAFIVRAIPDQENKAEEYFRAGCLACKRVGGLRLRAAEAIESWNYYVREAMEAKGGE